MLLSRRKLITGLISLATAPAIVRAESLMPVKVMKPILTNAMMEPFLREWQQKVYDAVMHGSSLTFDVTGIQTIKNEDFYLK